MIAVDSSEATLSQIKQKFSGLDRIDYRLGETGSRSIQDGTVDYAFANMYLHHVEFPSKTIEEMARILTPRGMLVITDLGCHRFEFLRREHNDRWMRFSRADIYRWFEEMGLQDVAIDCADEDCCASSSYGSENTKISMFVALGRKY